MFAKLFALFAFLAVAFASPRPEFVSYTGPAIAPVAGVAPVAYSGYTPYTYTAPVAAAYPYGYSAYYVK